ncbi:VOC family protein [Pseudonocardia nigra]|uniref:VOC family protein n=1 Tax=Pseudonocardia nigra TaxID=1921578 RepID=UPI001C605B9F|nr:VOC family protein [Pseudonocardia nigra]
MAELDHLVLAVPDLDAALPGLAARLGAPAVPGGAHPGWGTRNALVGLGPGAYLEIIGPDPAQDVERRAFGVDAVPGPTLVAWAVRPGVGETFEALVAGAGAAVGPVRAMSRRRTDGRELHWRLTEPRVGPMPFLIDWGATPHPAAELPAAAELRSLALSDPVPDALSGTLRWMGLAESVSAGDPRITAVLRRVSGALVELDG